MEDGDAERGEMCIRDSPIRAYYWQASQGRTEIYFACITCPTARKWAIAVLTEAFYY